MGKIITVTGEIPDDELGITLSHEHLYCDLSAHGSRDNVIMDPSLICEELHYFQIAGGCSIIEMTPVDIGRNAEKLKEISETSGVQIISGIAVYKEYSYPAWVFKASTNQITEFFVNELEKGTNGVRAGLIGELASHDVLESTSDGYRLSEIETRVFEAAAKAQQHTGVALCTHACEGHGGIAQLDILEKNGANLNKVAIGHCDGQLHDKNCDVDYYLAILERGAYCGFDLIGWQDVMPDEVRADRIASLIRLGYENKLLLSTDTCRLSQLHHYHGRGFDYLLKSFVLLLKERCITESQLNSMLVNAPKKLLSRN